MSEVRWMQGGSREKGSNNHHNNALDCLFECSTAVLHSRLTEITSKKLAFKFSVYIFEYQLLPPYVRDE